MNGVDYLLDTNFILGMLKSDPDVLDAVESKQLVATQCGYSAVTRMDISKTRDLLGWVPPVSMDEGLRRAVGACQPTLR